MTKEFLSVYLLMYGCAKIQEEREKRGRRFNAQDVFLGIKLEILTIPRLKQVCLLILCRKQHWLLPITKVEKTDPMNATQDKLNLQTCVCAEKAKPPLVSLCRTRGA